MQYTGYFSKNGKDFEYDFNVSEDIAFDDRLEHVHERAEKLAQAQGWGYSGVGPKLEPEDLDFQESMTL